MADGNEKALPDLSGILDMLGKNPELMQTALKLFSSIPGEPPKVPEPTESAGESVQVASPVVSPAPSGFDPSVLAGLLSKGTSGLSVGKSDKAVVDRRAALLSALKPYLSKEKREAVDYMLKFSQLGDLMKVFERKE